MDDKLKKIIYIVLGAFMLLFLFLFIISSCSNKTYSFESFETQIVKKTKKYYESHTDLLPQNNSVFIISIEDLYNRGIIDNISKTIGKDANCSGSIAIENNNNYYMYSPNITCVNSKETYETINLKDKLIENVTTTGNGLYKIGDSYYFRGDNVNNYIMFDGAIWRIVKVNNDDTIKLIETGSREQVVWDNRYNNEANSTTGYNNYVYENINSRIKDSLDDIYNGTDEKNKILSDNAKGYIKATSLCIGKRNPEEAINDGSIECSDRLENQYVGLLQLNEYILASLDNNCINANSTACSNYNYLADFDNSYWTITANSESNNKVYKIYNTINSSYASNSAMNRMVINISENTAVKGEGTIDNPFIVTGMPNEQK